jgi:hypothetical protein
MGATPKFGLRYPELTDPADVPTDMHELATDTETAFGLFQALSARGQPNGYASLDASGLVPAAQLPATGGGGLSTAPFFRIYKANSQAIPANVLTPVTFDGSSWDNDHGWAVSPNPSRYTVKTAGFWYIRCVVVWSGATGGTSGERMASIRVTAGASSGYYGGILIPAPGSAGQYSCTPTDALIWMNVGDYVEVMAFENGVAGSVNVSPTFPAIGINTEFAGVLCSTKPPV